jgi:cellulose synthase/poly-beta-1,6-N-acetylglucosamine synthase-like glycosyltransferase
MIESKIIADITMAVGIGYIFTALYLLSHPTPKKSRPKNLPPVAILVPMRNEEMNIEYCLKSLENQNYPLHLHDIFVIDDRSTDKSVNIAGTFIERYENFHLFRVNEDQNNLKGKMNALAQVLETIEHEIVLITDADCRVPSTWIQTFVDYFDEETGLAGGLTVLESTPNMVQVQSNLFAKIQTLDWVFLQTIAAATASAGVPVSVLGNNFGFRLQTYQEIGTFREIGFSVTEDFALLKAIDKTGKWKIKYAIDPENTIYSKPAATLSAFFKQRKRWIVGGRSMRLWGYFIVGLSFLAHLCIMASLIFGERNISAALGIGLIIGIDYFIIKRELNKTGLEKLKKYFLLFEVFFISYTLFFGIAFPFFRKVTWKDRSF